MKGGKYVLEAPFVKSMSNARGSYSFSSFWTLIVTLSIWPLPSEKKILIIMVKKNCNNSSTTTNTDNNDTNRHLSWWMRISLTRFLPLATTFQRFPSWNTSVVPLSDILISRLTDLEVIYYPLKFHQRWNHCKLLVRIESLPLFVDWGTIDYLLRTANDIPKDSLSTAHAPSADRLGLEKEAPKNTPSTACVSSSATP